MLKKTALLLSFSAAMLLSGCGDPILDVVEENLAALQEKDMARVMATIDRQSPAYDTTKAELERMISGYDLNVEVESMEIIKQPRNETMTEEEKAQQEQAILEEDLNFITEGEQTDAVIQREQELEKERNRPYVAKVKVVQITRRLDPKAPTSNTFYDNRVTVVHTLRKYPKDDVPAWKLFESDVTDVSFRLAEE